jgi:hypothetical protein
MLVLSKAMLPLLHFLSFLVSDMPPQMVKDLLLRVA